MGIYGYFDALTQDVEKLICVHLTLNTKHAQILAFISAKQRLLRKKKIRQFYYE